MDRLKFKVRSASIIKNGGKQKNTRQFSEDTINANTRVNTHSHAHTPVIECKLKCKCCPASFRAARPADGKHEHDGSDKFGMSKSGVALSRVFTRSCPDLKPDEVRLARPATAQSLAFTVLSHIKPNQPGIKLSEITVKKWDRPAWEFLGDRRLCLCRMIQNICRVTSI